MDSEKLFGPTIDLAAKALDLRTRKHQLLLSNIANADTPGYKAFDLMVEEAMVRQTPSVNGQVRLTSTHTDHLTSAKASSTTAFPEKVQHDAQISLRGDGNSVDMEREMTQLAVNQLLFKASTQILSNKLRGMKTAIQGGLR